ncbi:hypothetical protein JVT61DRAFT_6325 [Boletus reticuloceps]|uniref:DUF6533 domain-containing protein n=1 Tax=Boletus reticuloceps TaxID=495285 RepID=A0A8I2YJL8_9AGAM|nr:hypothetical protein JVT61DRAFT_6325 [Boletus reticuloceps]
MSTQPAIGRINFIPELSDPPFISTSGLPNHRRCDLTALHEVHISFFCHFPSALSAGSVLTLKTTRYERSRSTRMAEPLSTINLERFEASQYVSGEYSVYRPRVIFRNYLTTVDLPVPVSGRAGGASPVLSNVPVCFVTLVRRMLLWDHVLTLPDEVELIWRAKLSIPKVLFLLNRYVVPLAMAILSNEFSGVTPYLSLPVSSCKVSYAIAVAIGMLSIATSNFLILLRLWVLWDRSPRLVFVTLMFFIVTQLVALSFVGYVIYDMLRACVCGSVWNHGVAHLTFDLATMFFHPVLRICIPRHKPKFVMLWTPGIVFELVVFLTAVWNALDRPRSRNVRVTKIMYRDGSLYFFVLLRLLNLLLCTIAPVSRQELSCDVCFIWSISNITLARFIFNLRRLSSDTCHKKVRFKDEEEIADDMERTELPVLRRERTGSGRSD